MDIRRKLARLGLAATLLATVGSVIGTTGAAAAVTVVSAGSVAPGGTSTGTVSFTFHENSSTAFPGSGGTLTLTLADSAGVPTIHFAGQPSISASSTLGGVSISMGPDLTSFTFNVVSTSGSVTEELVASGVQLRADQSAAGGAVTATLSGSLASAVSATTALASPATVGGATTGTFLAFTTQPGGGTAGSTWAQQPVVAVENALNAVDTTDNTTVVTLAIGTNPANGVLTCTGGNSRTVVNGIASFAGCAINSGCINPYTLVATASTDATAATSATFLVGTGNHLDFLTQPGGGAAGSTWAQQPLVAVENGINSMFTTDSTTVVTLSIGTNPGGGVLTCTGGNSRTVFNGYASFAGCAISAGSASPYTLVATASSGTTLPTSATSATFLVTGPGASTQLAFTTQPGGGAAGTGWAQQPVVAVQNTLNNVVTTDSTTVVTLSIGTNPGGGVLTCTGGNSRTVVSGVATFAGCAISAGAATPYTLIATASSGATSATSATFLVTGASTPPHLAFITQPGGGAAGSSWALQPVVAVQNPLNAVVTTDNTTVVTLAIGTNPASGVLACAGGNSRLVVNGIASFGGCAISAGSAGAYTLVATASSGATSATSAPFLVTVVVTQVSLTSATAVGNTLSGFSTSTKVVPVGSQITLRIVTSPSLAGQRLGIWIAKKTNGVWSAFSQHASVTVGADGVAYYVYSAGSKVWLSLQARFNGSATFAPAVAPARQARWT